MKDKVYNGDSIDMLNDIEAIRLKAGMYCGDLGVNGLHHLLTEVISNSVDEMLNNRGNEISVILHPDDWVEVIDNGSGIPTEMNKKHNMNALDLIMLFRHSGGKLKPEETMYKKGSIGTNGLGLFITNCLTEHIIIISRRNRKVYKGEYGGGKQIKPVEIIGDLTSDVTGTSIKWKVDKKLFSYGATYERERILARLKMLSYMVPKIKIYFKDLREADNVYEESFYSERGLIDMLDDKIKGKALILRNPIHIKEEMSHKAQKYNAAGEPYVVDQNITIEVCFTYEPTQREERILTFVNGNDVPLGGTMVTGFKRGLTKAINEFAKDRNLLKDKDPDFKYNELKDGLICCIHINHPDPSFDGQTKVKINNSELDSLTNTLIYEKLTRYGIDYPRELDKLVDFFIKMRKGRASAEKALDKELNKIIQPSSKGIVLSQYVTDCSASDPKERELIIVEGLSALGSSKEARDSRTQAILPLRGKMINTYKGALNKVLKNNEVQALLKVIGCGSTHSSNFDISKCRYGKIIIMSDADVDGKHITLLVLTFLHEFLKPLIEAGMVYITTLPLFKISTVKEMNYYYDDASFQKAVENYRIKGTKFLTSRFKGLGEMNGSELHEVGFNVDNRRLLKVSLEDTEYALDIVDKIMGDSTDYRKHLLSSVNGDDLDI